MPFSCYCFTFKENLEVWNPQGRNYQVWAEAILLPRRMSLPGCATEHTGDLFLGMSMMEKEPLEEELSLPASWEDL